MKEDFRRGVTRRDFLRLLGIGTAAITGGFIWEATQKLQENEAASFAHELETHRIIYPKNDIPEDLRGFYMNMVYTYLADKSEWDAYIQQVKKFDATRARIYIGDEFEPKIGEYNFSVLDKASAFIDSLNRTGMGAEVDFFDCYFLGNSMKFNPMYNSYPPSSPYNTTFDNTGYRNFFIDHELVEKFQNRAVAIIRGLRKRNCEVQVWSVANEPDPGLIGENGSEVLTEWYKKVMPVIQSENAKVPIVPGVMHPWDIDYQQIPYLTSNTAHIYLDTNLTEVGNYLQRNDSPLIVQEFGVPYRILGIDTKLFGIYDFFAVNHLLNILQTIMQKTIDPFTGEEVILARASSFGGWKVAPNEDAFSFSDSTTSFDVKNIVKALGRLRAN